MTSCVYIKSILRNYIMMRNYYFTIFRVSVSGSEDDSVLCSWFGISCFRLEICLSVSGFGFSILFVCFFFRVFDVYFRILSVCFVYWYKEKLSVFYIV